MPSISYEGRSFTVEGDEPALETLLRNGVAISHSCKAGSCGSCLVRAVRGVPPARAQSGLKDSWKAQGYLLACVCRPEADLELAPVGQDARVPAAIVAKQDLGANVLRVRLHCGTSFEFRSGQYIALIRPDGLSRSYSIASLPEEGEIELHVRLIPGGKMSGWLRDEARVGDSVSLQGPSGECFYVPGREEQPLLLVGTGTGLAPLYGIIRDALRHGHRGPIHLFHGAVQREGLYLVGELRRLQEEHSHFEYTPTVLNGEPGDDLQIGSIDQVVLKRFPKLANWRGFLCGDPAIVQTLKKKLFLGGMASRDIYADAFLPSCS